MIVLALGLYALEGIAVNPFIIWTASPIAVGYLLLRRAWRTPTVKHRHQAYGFLIASVGLSYLYHLAWFFNWGNMNSGSTSALIFIFFPLYALLFGAAGLLIGSFTGKTDDE